MPADASFQRGDSVEIMSEKDSAWNDIKIESTRLFAYRMNMVRSFLVLKARRLGKARWDCESNLLQIRLCTVSGFARDLKFHKFKEKH